MNERRSMDHRDFAVLSAELIENTGGLRFRARGRSMVPCIRDGDILTVEKVDPSHLRTGEVILGKVSDNLLLAHRIIARKGDSWTICGDALIQHDPPLPADRIMGRVSSIERGEDKIDMTALPRRLSGRLRALIGRHPRAFASRILRRLLRAVQ